MSLSSPVTEDNENDELMSPNTAARHEKQTNANDYAAFHIPTRGAEVSNDKSKRSHSDGGEGEAGDDGDDGKSSKEDSEPFNEEEDDRDGEELLSEMPSDFLQTDTSRRSLRLTSALLNYARPPGLNLVPLGASACVDVFARLGNGVRRAFIDMYNMIEEMRRRVEEVRTKRVQLFFDWWMTFSSFLSTSLDTYAVLLLPWAAVYGDGADMPDIKAVVESVSDTIEVFENIEQHVARRAPDETVARIIRAVETMGAPVARFLHAVENAVPDVLDAAGVTDKEIRKIERKVLKYMHRHGPKESRKFHIFMVERGMSMEECAAWKASIVPFLLKLVLWTSAKRFETQYTAIVTALADGQEI